MKKILYILVSIIAAILLSSSACEEIINPQDEGLLIDKTVSPSEKETMLAKGNDIQIIIPGGALTEDATFKVEKASNPPEMNMDKMLLGKNVFKINISGQSNFDKPIQIVINYSQSKLDDNDLTDDDVRGLIYKNGSWAEATYTLDKENKKIIISITTPTGKIKSEGDIPHADGDIVIGDGYSIGDSGSQDNLLKTMKDLMIILEHDDSFIMHYRNRITIDSKEISGEIIWSGDNFTVDMNSQPGHPHSTNTLAAAHYILKLNANTPSNGFDKINSLNISQILDWSWISGVGLDSTEAEIDLIDIPLIFTSETKDTLIYEIADASKSSSVQYYYLMKGGIDFVGGPSTYYKTYSKANVENIRFVFTK